MACDHYNHSSPKGYPLLLKEMGRIAWAFTLLELSVSIAIIALIMSGSLVLISNIVSKHQGTDAQIKLDKIVIALENYYQRNGHLPCPASRTDAPNTANFGKQVNSGDCTYTVAPAGTARIETVASSGLWMLVGVVPTRDLLLRDDSMNDGYGNRFTYAVAQPLADSATFDAGTGTITIKDSAGNNIITDGAYVMLSHGKTGEGAYRFNSGSQTLACGATNLDIENCDADTTFMDATFNNGTVAASFFDDYIRWKSKQSLD